MNDREGSFGLVTNSTLRLASIAVLSVLALTAQPQAATNYDTAWTFFYDGGSILDIFWDVVVLPNGSTVCGGVTGDTTTGNGDAFIAKLGSAGGLVWAKKYATQSQNPDYNRLEGRSITIAENGDYILGGVRWIAPYVMRTDSAGNLKWARWVYDSTNNRQSLFLESAKVNCVRETSRGTIICAAGDYFTDLGYAYGSTASDYDVFLELSDSGSILNWGEAWGQAGYSQGGFGIEETALHTYVIAGNQTVACLDTNGVQIWTKKYTFMLDGVGSMVNNIVRCKPLRDGRLVVAGMAYEGNCWTNYQRLYYDAWWSPISYAGGSNITWDTAGVQGGNDQINDFTQLIDGKLVFIGKRDVATGTTGIWVYVCSDSSNEIYWEREIAGSLYGCEPYSVCATPDSGFTVVGKRGASAFAAHFVPAAPAQGSQRPAASAKPTAGFTVTILGTRLTVTGIAGQTGNVRLFDFAGKRVAAQVPVNSADEIVLDISGLSRGAYVVKVMAGNAVRSAVFTMVR